MKKHALVIGVSEYEDADITDLAFAAADAREVGRVFEDTCDFDEVRLLATGSQQRPTHVRIVDALRNMAPSVGQDDLFVLFFAGHGIHTDGATYLLTCNSYIHMPELASLRIDVLQRCLSHLECRQRVLILDACRNDPHKGRGDGDNLLSEEFSRDIECVARSKAGGVVPATCLLFSCSEGERAWEWPDRQHGAFSYYLLEGLKDNAWDQSGRLTVQSLAAYVEEQVPEWSARMDKPRLQHPWSRQEGSLRDVVLAVCGVGKTSRIAKKPTDEYEGLTEKEDEILRPPHNQNKETEASEKETEGEERVKYEGDLDSALEELNITEHGEAYEKDLTLFLDRNREALLEKVDASHESIAEFIARYLPPLSENACEGDVKTVAEAVRKYQSYKRAMRDSGGDLRIKWIRSIVKKEHENMHPAIKKATFRVLDTHENKLVAIFNLKILSPEIQKIKQVIEDTSGVNWKDYVNAAMKKCNIDERAENYRELFHLLH